jgi:hypothetical protein
LLLSSDWYQFRVAKDANLLAYAETCPAQIQLIWEFDTCKASDAPSAYAEEESSQEVPGGTSDLGYATGEEKTSPDFSLTSINPSIYESSTLTGTPTRSIVPAVVYYNAETYSDTVSFATTVFNYIYDNGRSEARTISVATTTIISSLSHVSLGTFISEQSSQENPPTQISKIPSATPTGSSISSPLSSDFSPLPLQLDPFHRNLTNCTYVLLGDMYGTGVRLGYYLQSLSTILSMLFSRGSDLGGVRGTTATMSLALTIAFVTGALSGSSLALEIPIFLAIATCISLPTLLQPFFVWPIRFTNVRGPASYIVMVLAYVFDLFFCFWGVVTAWYAAIPQQCDILAGISGESVLSSAGYGSWIIFSSLGVVLCVVFLTMGIGVLCALPRMLLRVPGSQKTWGEILCGSRNINITDRALVALWTVFAVGTVGVCIAAVELTFKRHAIQTSELETGQYGQWMALIAGVAGMVSTSWAVAMRTVTG